MKTWTLDHDNFLNLKKIFLIKKYMLLLKLKRNGLITKWSSNERDIFSLTYWIFFIKNYFNWFTFYS